MATEETTPSATKSEEAFAKLRANPAFASKSDDEIRAAIEAAAAKKARGKAGKAAQAKAAERKKMANAEDGGSTKSRADGEGGPTDGGSSSRASILASTTCRPGASRER